MESYGIAVVNEGVHPECKWLFSFGAYGCTHVLVVGVRGIEDALEAAAGWLADHAPGHLIASDSEDYAHLLRDACETHGASFEAYQYGDIDPELCDRITQHAETDLTYTESGYLTSFEWTVTQDPDRQTILWAQKR